MIIISIIIVTHNSSEYIHSCLGSIFAQSFHDYEVIVTDNGSEDSTKSIIRSKYPDIMLIENERNFGSSRARNQGIARARGKFVLCLDSDVVLEKDCLERLYKVIKDKENIFAMQPKVLKRNSKIIDTTGIFLSKSRRFYDLGRNQKDNGKFNQKRYIFGPSSAAALYRKEMLERISLNGEYFDEDFFFLVEDVDLAWRANRFGWKTIFSPEAICYHWDNSSKYKYNFYFRQYLCFRNRYLLMLKNDSLKDVLVNTFYILPYDITRFIYFLFTNRYTFRALAETKKLFPKMRRKRFLIEEKLRKNT